MAHFVPQAAEQLLVFGTQVYPAFPSLARRAGGLVGSGLVRLGYTDPADVLDVHLDPDNPRVPLWVEVRPHADPNDSTPGLSLPSDEPRRLRIIHVDTRPSSPTFGRRVGTHPDERGRQVDETGEVFDGSCFLFRVNHPMNARFGRSDLETLERWLDQAEWFFTDMAQYVYFLTNFVFDVSIDGATESELDLRRNQIRTRPPSRGSVLVHSEKESWQAVTPDLRQEDLGAAARTMVWWIAGIGAGIPEHWLGWGRETTRATADQMQIPTLHMLQSRQSALRALLSDLCSYQIDTAIRARVLPPDVDTSFTINLPELLPPNSGEIAATLKTVADALSTPAAQAIMPPERQSELLDLLHNSLTLDLLKSGSRPSTATQSALPSQGRGQVLHDAEYRAEGLGHRSETPEVAP